VGKPQSLAPLIRGRGLSKGAEQELQALKEQRLKAPGEFDKNPENIREMERLKGLERNRNRSMDNNKNFESIGLPNSEENNLIILNHFLEVGKSVKSEHSGWVRSELEGPNGKLAVRSVWKYIDGRPYLSSFYTMPMTGKTK
jgi:hypothetical protein